MYKITPWHYYNAKFGVDDIKAAPNFCGGDSSDELQVLDATKDAQKVPPDTVKNLIVKSSDALGKEILKPFGKNLEHLYLLSTSGTFAGELLENCENLRGLYIAYNKNFKQVPAGFFQKSRTLRRLVINHAEIALAPGIFLGLEGVEDLDLQENRLAQLEAGILSDLPKLQKLIVARNKITQIHPGAFANNVLLAHIDLSNNALETWRVDCLPGGNVLKYLKLSHNRLENDIDFSTLRQLFQLNLDFNRIAKVDRNVFGTSLERLDYLALNNNKITGIAEDALDLKALRVLALDHNKLQALPPKVFVQVPQLQQLSLDHNDFTSMDIDVFAPLKALNNLVLGCCNLMDLTNPSKTGPEGLASLHLDDNNLAKLSQLVFAGFSAVTTLELNDCKIETLENGWCVGLEALKQLNLSGNQIRELKCAGFKTLKVLKTLNLSGNRIATIEKSAFGDLEGLSSLNLCDNRLEGIGDYMFDDLGGLRSLALGNNEITSVKNNSLGCLPSLIYLDVSENRITEVEEQAFANVKNLVTLDLGYNGLTTWPDLTHNTELGKLILSYNYLKQFDSRVLSIAGLSQLHIDNNDIKSIDLGLLEASAVREFNFDETKVDAEVAEKIRSLLQVRQIRRRSSVRIEPREKCRKVVL